jgi:hypothetical protein
VSVKDQGNYKQKKAAERVGEDSGNEERALHGVPVAKAHNEGVVEAARAAVQCEAANDGADRNVPERKINAEDNNTATTDERPNQQSDKHTQIQVFSHAEGYGKNEQHVQQDQRGQQGD